MYLNRSYLGEPLTGMLSVPKSKEQKRKKKKSERREGTGGKIAALSEGPTRDACQSAEPPPALSPQKLCLVTILPGTGEQPGVFLRSWQRSDKLRCVIGNRSEPQARWTRHGSMVGSGCPSSAGALPWFGGLGGSRGRMLLRRERFALMCTAPQVPKQAACCYSLYSCACPRGSCSSCACRSCAL